MLSFNNSVEARDYFINCLNVGPNFDVRIRKECVEQLQKLFREESIPSSRLDSLHQSFRHRNRDFIFLVNQSEWIDHNNFAAQTMRFRIPKIRQTLTKILENDNGAVEDKDRISLIKYARNLRRIFTLVEKEKNFVQLKNQVETLTVDEDQPRS